MANALNPNIILAGQGLDVVGAMDAGAIAGQRANQFKQQNALNSYLQQNGAQVMGGDQGALNALAGFGMDGLNAAQGVQSNRLGMEQTRLGMDATRQNMTLATSQEARLTRQEERAIQEHAATMSAAARQAEAAQIEQAVAMGLAAQSPEQWDAVVSQTAPDLVGQFDNREMIAGRYMSVAEVLKRSDDMNGAAAPQSPQGKLAADLRDGLISPEQFNAANEKSGMRVSVGRDGQMVFEQGPGVTGGSQSGMKPSSPEAMLSTIEGILSDPALDTSTGILAPLQNIPGTPQMRFAGRANQLEGQAFLQAFESLKGAGQITEIEGSKATQAIGRLNTAQSPADYRDALGELQGILETAIRRGGGSANDFSQMTANDLMAADMSDWSAADFAAYNKRMDELGL